MINSTDKFQGAKIGDRVRLNDGCTGYTYGKVYGRIRSRFGDALRIKLDDFTFTTIESFVTDGSTRIGAYLLKGKQP
jgi:hypothetical protein